MISSGDRAGNGSKVLIVVTSHEQLGETKQKTGLWLSEATHPYHVLHQAGFEVEFASTAGGRAPIDPLSVQEADNINQAFCNEPVTREALEHTLALSDINPDDYAAVLFSGGHGTVWDFTDNPDIDRIAGEIYHHGGVVAALCHGTAALLNIHDETGELLIKGKQVAGFSNAEERAIELDEVVPYLLEDKIRASGARYSGGAQFHAHVVCNERIITGQNPQSAIALGEAMASQLRH